MNDSVGKHNKRQRNFSQSVIIKYNVGLIRKIIILLYHREKSKENIFEAIGACKDANSMK